MTYVKENTFRLSKRAFKLLLNRNYQNLIALKIFFKIIIKPKLYFPIFKKFVKDLSNF